MVNEIQSSFPTLQFTALAKGDIEETWYYLGEFGDDVAERFVRQIMEKCVVLSKNPKLGRERNDLILNMRQFPFRNFNIYYFTTDFGVEIYRVLHSSRDSVQVFGDTIYQLKVEKRSNINLLLFSFNLPIFTALKSILFKQKL